MTAPEILNLDEPYPNVVIDKLRRTVKAQIDELSGEVQRIEDALLLLDTTADMAQSTLNVAKAARTQFANLTAAIGQIQAAVGQLGARVTALENAAKTTTTGGTP